MIEEIKAEYQWFYKWHDIKNRPLLERLIHPILGYSTLLFVKLIKKERR